MLSSSIFFQYSSLPDPAAQQTHSFLNLQKLLKLINLCFKNLTVPKKDNLFCGVVDDDGTVAAGAGKDLRNNILPASGMRGGIFLMQQVGNQVEQHRREITGDL